VILRDDPSLLLLLLLLLLLDCRRLSVDVSSLS
jgi:hypothetical protein